TEEVRARRDHGVQDLLRLEARGPERRARRPGELLLLPELREVRLELLELGLVLVERRLARHARVELLELRLEHAVLRRDGLELAGRVRVLDHRRDELGALAADHGRA